MFIAHSGYNRLVVWIVPNVGLWLTRPLYGRGFWPAMQWKFWLPRNVLTCELWGHENDARANIVLYFFAISQCNGPKSSFYWEEYTTSRHIKSNLKFMMNVWGTSLQLDNATIDWSSRRSTPLSICSHNI